MCSVLTVSSDKLKSDKYTKRGCVHFDSSSLLFYPASALGTGDQGSSSQTGDKKRELLPEVVATPAAICDKALTRGQNHVANESEKEWLKANRTSLLLLRT